MNLLYVILFSIIFILVCIFFLIWSRKVKKQEELKRQVSSKLLCDINTFNQDYRDRLCSHYITIEEAESFKEKWKPLIAELKGTVFLKKLKEYETICSTIAFYDNLDEEIKSSNDKFISSLLSEAEENYLTIGDINFDSQQAEVIVSDERRTLVIAGAGSGKTLTIVGKIQYLCLSKKIKPEEILLISFTNKSADEMTERIKQKLGIDIEAKTFHKLGLDIIMKAWNQRPEVYDNIPAFVQNIFEEKLLRTPGFIKNVATFFFYYLDIPDDISNFDSLGELYEAEKEYDLETLKSKYQKEQYLQETHQSKKERLKTLKDEYVKSKEETMIANFLFLHGIKYEYERPYPYESDDAERKKYHPDFYLVDYDIYLEHFGITEDNRCPWLSSIEEEKYIDSIQWKREFHESHGTKLIETYSYYTSKGILFNMLEKKLRDNDVKFEPLDFNEIFQTIYINKSNKYFSEFMKLCCTFISLYKSNNYDISKLNEMMSTSKHNPFFEERNRTFLEIIKNILFEYEIFLKKSNAIDFSDMINIASRNVILESTIPSYKYVIVDEYQDLSFSRYTLLKAVVDATSAKLLCVGDDWQSIYRFSGSDISLFTDFEDYFGKTNRLKIEKTYRNSQQLIDEASTFITKNPIQITKNLKSDKKLDYPLVFWGYDKDPVLTLERIINKIISEFGPDKSIMIIGRNNFDIEMLKNSSLFSFSIKNRCEIMRYLPSIQTPISYTTVHKSKGLEADNAILINFKNDKVGFPNQIANDMVLDFVIKKDDDFPFSEERRLFYVAITRTKNRTFVLTDNKAPSIFLKEFKESKSCCFVNIRKNDESISNLCPRCKTGTLYKITNARSSFIGCSNYPRCNFTIKETDALLEPKKCPQCGGYLTRRKAKNNHPFFGCTNYPYCDYTEPLPNATES